MEIVAVAGAAPEAFLVSPNEFDAFKVTLRGDRDAAAVDAALALLGDRVDEDHVAVAPDTVRRLAGDAAASEEWEAGFGAMVEYARGHGWMVGEAIRAHVEHED